MFRDFPFDRVNWFTSSFLIITFFTALIGTPLYFYYFGFDPLLVGLAVLYFILSGMGITMGYHRLFAHRAYQAKWPVRLGTLIFGACAFEDSALDWASDHRSHHKHTDHDDDDPYSISRGFFWAHIGWIFFKLYPRELTNVNDLRKDKLVMWQHKYHYWIGGFVGMILPSIIGYLWNGWVGALGGFLIVGIARVVAVQHSTFFINSLCHTIGRQPYSTNGSARDSWIMALFTFGEGYHNYHHAFQHDYRNGVKKWHWDPTKWAIWTCEKLGLVSNLRRVSREKIVLAELRETRKQAREQLKHIEEEKQAETCPIRIAAIEKLQSLSQSLQENYNHIEEAVSNRMAVSRESLDRAQKNAGRVLNQIGALKNLRPATV